MGIHPARAAQALMEPRTGWFFQLSAAKTISVYIFITNSEKEGNKGGREGGKEGRDKPAERWKRHRDRGWREEGNCWL